MHNDSHNSNTCTHPSPRNFPTSRTPKHSTKRGFSSAGNARLKAQAAAGESAKSGATSQKDSPLRKIRPKMWWLAHSLHRVITCDYHAIVTWHSQESQVYWLQSPGFLGCERKVVFIERWFNNPKIFQVADRDSAEQSSIVEAGHLEDCVCKWATNDFANC